MIRPFETINIPYEEVKLQMLEMRQRLDYVRRLISTMKGSLVLERISCNECLTQVNPLCETVLVNIRTITFGKKSFEVLEPKCPVCGTFITSEQFLRPES